MNFFKAVVGFYRENCYFLFDEDKNGVIIDPGDEPDEIINLIYENNLDIKAILLTHAHFDHVGALKQIENILKVPVYMNKEDIPLLISQHDFFKSSLEKYRFINDGDEIKIGNLNILALHTPGHTEGSMTYICGDIMFTGDTLFAGSIGRTDLFGGSAKTLKKTIAGFSNISCEYQILSGHGPASVLSYEKCNNPYMKNTDLIMN